MSVDFWFRAYLLSMLKWQLFMVVTDFTELEIYKKK